jgi:hypothetical protein
MDLNASVRGSDPELNAEFDARTSVKSASSRHVISRLVVCDRCVRNVMWTIIVIIFLRACLGVDGHPGAPSCAALGVWYSLIRHAIQPRRLREIVLSPPSSARVKNEREKKCLQTKYLPKEGASFV